MSDEAGSTPGSQPPATPPAKNDNDNEPPRSTEPDTVEGTEVASNLSKEEQSHQSRPTKESMSEPPLPQEEVPPLPDEAVPSKDEYDGWQPIWEETAQAFYFYNHITGVTTWTNPRMPEAVESAPGIGNHDRIRNGDEGEAPTGEEPPPRSRPHGGYDPAIHGDYDPTAPYAQEPHGGDAGETSAVADPNAIQTATGSFNRFTGKWQAASLTPENFNDENKSRRQMSAFFDVDAAANSHDGKSLKAERAGKKLTKKEVKSFKEKRREKKEEKRRAWLRD
ncbi:MAG: hypothetical protein M1837_002625 [Sclerophora amabilis]|nr:MAG: hypothetical protein M1837_002625 [Sclerophora amabilis]